jgi:hypothetical protein
LHYYGNLKVLFIFPYGGATEVDPEGPEMED